MSFSDQDRAFMRKALALAEEGRGSVEPNPMVGAVIVRDDRIVGRGYHRRFGGRHAEVFALRDAGDLAEGATMYVTLEPCDHEGKTPACAPMVAQSGLRHVVAATRDPTAKAGGGLKMLAEQGVCAQAGLCREEAARLNAGFFKLAAMGRPLVLAKWAMSADGKIATVTGSSRWISSPEARKLVHRVRGQVDCIVVGARAALRDDPLLTCRDAERRRTAARLVLCGEDLPAEDSQLVRTAHEAPVLLAYPAAAPPRGLDRLLALGCEALPVHEDGRTPGWVGLEGLLDELGARRMTNVLVEGGGAVLGSFFDARLVDRVMAFVAPLIIGGAGATTPVAGSGVEGVQDALRLHECGMRAVGPDVLIEGWVVDPLSWAP